ncbi:UDP-glucose 4-epimerase GalE [Ferroacidibacillus organovorans]|uniref:UDP-glucose 4-epimerase n=1 Tax=Ferroacidibacillus organovorans TaxID=1765683 RepID=A0A1V4EQA7_9BACL|nr:UDP-glucose 4-epimerase GalE [Ferroacidibacillus organovorans]OPG14924.1 UDP-glucose 4-epimerase GalE [Ferroacidibacillus organovorans]
MAILVTGGAGYIGSHTVAELKEHGEEVVVVDNLTTGHRGAVLDTPFYAMDLRDSEQMIAVLKKHNVDAVVHFAAYSLVGESVKSPLKYYENNVAATAKLLSAMVEAGVSRIVFSSTAAVYGEPERMPIEESAKKEPTNPYGETKLAIEKMLDWCYQAYGLKSIRLRYFNAAGAHATLPIGEDHRPESHLIPLVLQVALGQREAVSVFGDDYPTPDGTCIRDYVHVSDLASAHRLAVLRLRSREGGAESFNLGNAQGFSVNEVIEVARKVTGHPIPAVKVARRAGDPAALVASSQQAREMLGWQPKYTDLSSMVASAWTWHQAHPNGYEDVDSPVRS